VRSHGGKLRQFFVRAFELFHSVQKLQTLRLRGSTRRDVANDRRHEKPFGALQRAENELDRERASIFRASNELDSGATGANALRAWVFLRSKPLREDPLGDTFWNDVLYLPAGERAAGISELLFRLRIQENDILALVHDHYRVGSGFQPLSIRRSELDTQLSLDTRGRHCRGAFAMR
jgi:hypothetical protein